MTAFNLASPSLAPCSLPLAYAEAEKFVRLRSQSFQYAVMFLPPARRRAMKAAYAFFRATDDMVDDGHCLPAELDNWLAEALRPSDQQTNPILAAWADVRERYGVQDEFVQELLTGIRSDLTPHRFEAFDEDLSRYCYRVASTVGLLTIPIVGLRAGVDFDQAAPYATALGIALQTTNILRDVGEDVNKGRIYLPRKELAAFGLTYADIEARVCDARFVGLMQHLIKRAQAYYYQAWPGLRLLSPFAQLAVGSGALLYQALLSEIARLNYDVFTHRACIPSHRKIRLLLQQWPLVVWPGRYQPFTSPTI